MERFKKLLIVLVVVTATGILGGCTSNSDISEYLEALLDTSYKNEISKFVDIKLGNEDDASQLYIKGIDDGAALFCESLNVPEGLDDDFKELYKDLLKLVKYKVGGAVKQSDGSYVVTVTCEKLNVFQPAIELYEENMAAIVDEWANSEEDIEDEEKQRQAVLEFKDSMETAMADATYDEPTEVTVRIELDDNKYTPNMDDVQELEKALLDWE
jgi:disulfide oxidoreductase YuzD